MFRKGSGFDSQGNYFFVFLLFFVSWSSGYDFPLTNATSVCSGKVLGSIPRETIFCIFAM
ncbi:hypothetical protein N7449_011477 [Penicillium cf. viridicatum]|uniref:Uncharacterized protein n=1 Tax=Penicillium cf. viridicatum TaxID=2972119 RepID=A0A9W9M2L7_9EURO|nr:hypothetical protein N7449_011477 [Penicillium cf. viridicatum]